jgi:zinc protease
MVVPRMEILPRRLDNGLRVNLVPDHVAPVVAVNLWYGVGSKHEPPGKTGFAHLFEHIMFQGSAHVGKAEHIALIQAAGGTANGTTWLDRTNYFETLPAHQLELALWLEADRMGTLLTALSQENLDNQREVVKNERRWSYDNRPYGSWSEKLQAHLFPPDHPYHHPTIGYMEDLERATLDDVRAFFETYYRPDNAVLTVVGDFEVEEAWGWIRQYFGPIPAGGPRPPLPDLSLPPRLGEERREVVRDRVPLARIYVGFRAPVFGDPAFEALEVACQILAGGKASRLHRRLVRETRLAQDVSVFALGFVGGASVAAGWVTARPGVELPRLEAAFLEELHALAGGPVAEDEVHRAQALIETTELDALQHAEERADRISMYDLLFGRPEMVVETLDRYRAVTVDAVRQVAEAVFRPDNRVVLTYLPLEEPADQATLPQPQQSRVAA